MRFASATINNAGLNQLKKVAIVQGNYIPWKGYFDLIAAVDEFILYDDVQYTRRDWRNRNQIKTPHGVQWLTVPTLVKGKYLQKIRETEIDGAVWAHAHWKTLTQNYRRAPHFDEIAEWLAPFYLEGTYSHLSPLNRRFLISKLAQEGLQCELYLCTVTFFKPCGVSHAHESHPVSARFVACGVPWR